MQRLGKLTPLKKTTQERIYTDAENNFSVDTNETIYMEDGNGNKTYTFKIERNNSSPDFLENLVLKDIGNSEFMAYISRYDKTAAESLGSISQNDLKNHITFTPLGTKTGAEIFGKYNPDPCQVMMPYASNEIYVPGSMCYTGEHDYAHIGSCNYATASNGYPPTTGYYTWDISYGFSDICGGGGMGGMPTGPSGGTTPVGGGSGGTSSLTNDCEKVKKPFNDLPTLRSKVQTLSTKVSDTKEYAITSIKNPDPANPIIDVPPGLNGVMSVPPNPSNIYTLFAHTHNSPSSSTFSVPSWADLGWISFVYQVNHKVDSNTVFIVITADGTRYALTISDWAGFTQALYMPTDPTNYDNNLLQISIGIGQTYFEGGIKGGQEIIPLIKENGTDKEQDLKYFLQMIKENNMGVNVFEIDDQFNTFTRVTLNSNNTIKRTNCN